MASSLISELPFGSYLVYSPHGSSDVSVRSRRYRDGIKSGNDAVLRQLVQHLTANFAATSLGAVLGPDVVLVPVPGSGVLVAGGLWVPRLIAEALVAAGFGRQVVPCLKRVEAVPKSAFQAAGGRPSARRHYDSMRVDAELIAAKRITLVDDFVTRGRTLLGGASRVAEAFPGVAVGAFALVRTKGLQPDVASLVEPCLGRIRRVGDDDADREP